MLTGLFDNLLKRDIKKITGRSLHNAGISKNKANVAATDESQTAKAATSLYNVSRIVCTHFGENEEEMAEVEWFHTFEPLDDLPQAVKDRVVEDKTKWAKTFLEMDARDAGIEEEEES
ncbi:hypothetical protein F441_04974 [Phytophthora nicotianae CJ01A1]|uniref:Uncharacterized protein n=2 Tax=Phytophthora nicotianae TaxID=4792 RepID=W2JH08_PHYNI|nr:hypothetical protein L915_04837 [Phytophthora nicotianae]ETL45047.1 hypothetical protein L916_04782 [Phytophthora nicotianae]ETP21501.1 hypothetical protein F441_04974 [Phytophthora nicotianae CJ01A1]